MSMIIDGQHVMAQASERVTSQSRNTSGIGSIVNPEAQEVIVFESSGDVFSRTQIHPREICERFSHDCSAGTTHRDDHGR